MKPFNLIPSIFVFASLFSQAIFAYAPMKDEMIPAAAFAPYNWTGAYAGLNAGVVKHTMNITDNQAATFSGTIQQVADLKFTGGFQVGFRGQLNANIVSGVYGVELGTNFSNAKFSKEYGSPFALYLLHSENELKNAVLLQLLGGIAADRTLLFLAAGVSWTNITGTTTNLDGLPFFDSFSVSKKALGTAVGGGLEYAFCERLSARFKVDVITSNAYSKFDNSGNRYQISNNTVQGTFGVNYRFA